MFSKTLVACFRWIGAGTNGAAVIAAISSPTTASSAGAACDVDFWPSPGRCDAATSGRIIASAITPAAIGGSVRHVKLGRINWAPNPAVNGSIPYDGFHPELLSTT